MKDDKELPIGVFDSGVGGLTVVKEIIQTLPNESIIFLGDTARVPYGNRGEAIITRFALEMADFLAEQRVKYLVAACNTISSTCLAAVQSMSPLPVLGVVEPAVEAALACSRTGRIGVIGTRATVASGFYEAMVKARNADANVYSQACPMFVPLAEEGMTHSPATRLLAEEYLGCFAGKDIDVLILACTHYPILRDVIEEVIGPRVALIDSARPTATRLASLLREEDLENPGDSAAQYRMYLTDAPGRALNVAATFFERELPGPFEAVSLGVMD